MVSLYERGSVPCIHLTALCRTSKSCMSPMVALDCVSSSSTAASVDGVDGDMVDGDIVDGDIVDGDIVDGDIVDGVSSWSTAASVI